MSFAIEHVDGKIAVVHVGKLLHYRNAAAFKAACQDLVESGTHHFILNFSETSILDSAGLGAIFSIHRDVASRNGQVVFAAASKSVEVVVQVTRIYKIFSMYENVQTALDAVRASNVAIKTRLALSKS